MNKITIKCHFTNRSVFLKITIFIFPFPSSREPNHAAILIIAIIIRCSTSPICKDKIATSGILKCTLDIYIINTKKKNICYSLSIFYNFIVCSQSPWLKEFS